jgi:hypothetical protein
MITVLNTDTSMPRANNTLNGSMDAKLSVKSAKVDTTLTRLSHASLYLNTALPLMFMESVPLVFQDIKSTQRASVRRSSSHSQVTTALSTDTSMLKENSTASGLTVVPRFASSATLDTI